ncbi:phosphate signaling complex protein PhoU [Desulfobaculum bizertense]|uniref:Phosphate-specific transport system accessory protein PhoU n=1 Tax=Desulfobaculum bizertense DSM 18034 TaxID=1121442 RepID=A0A1T4VEI2_9BACT|nr:phosphate signaling complex protein PhoU [Desulfobaculum bizertense]UIJ37605.1 phosphate signaling complex protein PhoU [Desulfobaculum bizertense]SKA62931.1 phosphate transport system protein [Desulfobaculum bizertense DSM 18034]
MIQERHFHRQLDELRMLALEMAAYTERAVASACEALLTLDREAAERVIENDSIINNMEMKIDEMSIGLLALDSPMARDLRFITGVRRTIIDLERLGDEAVNIAEKTRYLSKTEGKAHPPMLEELVSVVLDMLKVAIEAFREENVDKAGDVCKMDETADELNVRILRQTMASMVAEATDVSRSVNTILAARHLERVGDLSTNIGETVVFINKGLNIKHRCHKS